MVIFLQICSATAGLYYRAGFVIPRIIILILFLLTASSISAEDVTVKWGSLIAPDHPV